MVNHKKYPASSQHYQTNPLSTFVMTHHSAMRYQGNWVAIKPIMRRHFKKHHFNMESANQFWLALSNYLNRENSVTPGEV
jgi:hypothetical protein